MITRLLDILFPPKAPAEYVVRVQEVDVDTLVFFRVVDVSWDTASRARLESDAAALAAVGL